MPFAPPIFSSIYSLLDFLVYSYMYLLWQANGIRTAALVPYADMLNHLRPRETKWMFEDSRQAFTVSSVMPIAAGAEVFDSYGQKCNHRFLLNYGYSVENNIESDGFCPNEVPLLLQVRSDDPLYDDKVLY